MKKPQAKKKLIGLFEQGYTVSAACQMCGISRQTYYRWCDSDPGFKEDMLKAHEEGVKLINDIAISNIIRGVQDGKYFWTNLWLRNNHSRYITPRKPHVPLVKKENPFPFDTIRVVVVDEKQVPDDPDDEDLPIDVEAIEKPTMIG